MNFIVVVRELNYNCLIYKVSICKSKVVEILLVVVVFVFVGWD